MSWLMDYLPDSVPGITEMVSKAEDKLLLAVNWIAFHFLRSLFWPTIKLCYSLCPKTHDFLRMTKSIYIYVGVCNFGWYLCMLVTIYTCMYVTLNMYAFNHQKHFCSASYKILNGCNFSEFWQISTICQPNIQILTHRHLQIFAAICWTAICGEWFRNAIGQWVRWWICSWWIRW